MNSGFDGKQNLAMIEREAHALVERRALDRLTGCVLVAFGLKLGVARRT